MRDFACPPYIPCAIASSLLPLDPGRKGIQTHLQFLQGEPVLLHSSGGFSGVVCRLLPAFNGFCPLDSPWTLVLDFGPNSKQQCVSLFQFFQRFLLSLRREFVRSVTCSHDIPPVFKDRISTILAKSALFMVEGLSSFFIPYPVPVPGAYILVLFPSRIKINFRWNPCLSGDNYNVTEFAHVSFHPPVDRIKRNS